MGSHAAFEQLVSLHADGLYGCIVGIVHDAAAARDVAQDAFVRALTSLAKLEDSRKFKPWLYAIAVNRGRDWLRRQRRQPVPFGRSPSGAPTNEDELPSTDASASPSGHAEMAERELLVSKALASLPVDYRDVAVLRFQEEFRVSEIADALGISVPAAESRLRRAREMLRGKLEGQL